MEKIENWRNEEDTRSFLFFFSSSSIVSFLAVFSNSAVQIGSTKKREQQRRWNVLSVRRVLLFFPVLIPRRSTVSHGKERKSPWHEKRGKKKKKGHPMENGVYAPSNGYLGQSLRPSVTCTYKYVPKYVPYVYIYIYIIIII